jgi:hypothetical protein
MFSARDGYAIRKIKIPAQAKLGLERVTNHSDRNASIGFSRDAFSAGQKPLMMTTTDRMMNVRRRVPSVGMRTVVGQVPVPAS